MEGPTQLPTSALSGLPLALVLTNPELVKQGWAYFRDVQTKTMKYQPLMRPEDKPAIELNKGIMERYRPAQARFYYDSTKHKSYLEQLGVSYPTVRRQDGVCPLPTPSATSAR